VNAVARRQVANLSLYVACGDLVVAFPIDEIARVLLADDIAVSSVDPKTQLSSISFEDDPIAAWDLGHLLGLRKVSAARAWIVIATVMDRKRRRFAVSCDRSLAVRPSQVDLALPARLFSSRAGAVTGAFSTQALDQSADLAPTGVALSAAHLLNADELRAVAGASAAGKLMW
jgi:hypothetical protein